MVLEVLLGQGPLDEMAEVRGCYGPAVVKIGSTSMSLEFYDHVRLSQTLVSAGASAHSLLGPVLIVETVGCRAIAESLARAFGCSPAEVKFFESQEL